MANSVVSLAGDQVLTIAQADAARLYRDLSPYRIQLVLEDDGWHVDYELKNPRLKGGSPHYVIDAQTGKRAAIVIPRRRHGIKNLAESMCPGIADAG